jgi:hypothetical protein
MSPAFPLLTSAAATVFLFPEDPRRFSLRSGLSGLLALLLVMCRSIAPSVLMGSTRETHP